MLLECQYVLFRENALMDNNLPIRYYSELLALGHALSNVVDQTRSPSNTTPYLIIKIRLAPGNSDLYITDITVSKNQLTLF